MVSATKPRGVYVVWDDEGQEMHVDPAFLQHACRHCHQPRIVHAKNEKCLYQPTTFEV